MTHPLRKGQRVNTVLGYGTVLGFETFHANGYSAEPMEKDRSPNGRVIVQLDQPDRWIGATEEFPHPYMYRSDFIHSGTVTLPFGHLTKEQIEIMDEEEYLTWVDRYDCVEYINDQKFPSSPTVFSWPFWRSTFNHPLLT